MANPEIHSKSSVKRYGGKTRDYLPIHQLIDSPKSAWNSNTVRALTHQTWFVYEILPKVFGYNITNSDGKSVDVVQVGLDHLAEDFRHKFIPTVGDYLKHLEIQPWMNNAVKDIDSEEAKNNLKLLKTNLID
jgi:hypothetical protein